MKCPTCDREGYEPPPKGRPKLLDDKKVLALHKKGKSLREIAAEIGVVHGAVHAAIKRSKGKK
jgi:hypothetical protein